MSPPVNKSAPSTPQSKTKPARKRAKAPILSIAYPDACGIDIGATSHFVAVPSDRDDEPVREFAAFTADLEHLSQAVGLRVVDVPAHRCARGVAAETPDRKSVV